MSATTCLFCRIIRRELPSAVVYEDDDVLAFRDIAPRAPVHLLVIPKRHIESLQALDGEGSGVMATLFARLVRLARETGVAHSGYRVVVNDGADGGQTVSHLHLHLLGGRPMTWPPG